MKGNNKMRATLKKISAVCLTIALLLTIVQGYGLLNLHAKADDGAGRVMTSGVSLSVEENRNALLDALKNNKVKMVDGKGQVTMSPDRTKLLGDASGVYSIVFTDTDADGTEELITFSIVNKEGEDGSLSLVALLVTGYNMEETGDVRIATYETDMDCGHLYEYEGAEQFYATVDNGHIVLLTQFRYEMTTCSYKILSFDGEKFLTEAVYEFVTESYEVENGFSIDGDYYTIGSQEAKNAVKAVKGSLGQYVSDFRLFPVADDGSERPDDMLKNDSSIIMYPEYDPDANVFIFTIEDLTGTYDTYHATIDITVEGNGSVDGAGQYTVGDYAELSATPDENNEFIGWYDGDTLIASESFYRFAVAENKTFTAKFRPAASVEDKQPLFFVETKDSVYFHSFSGVYDPDTFTYGIRLQNNPGVCKFELALDYDHDVFDLISFELDDGFSDCSGEGDVFTVSNADNTYTQDVVLKLTFRINANEVLLQDDMIAFTINSCYSYDENHNPESVQAALIQNYVTIAIVDEFSQVDPNDDSYGLGDVNGDGVLTAQDARLILRYVASLEQFSAGQLAASDIDSDGKVTAADARLALRISAQLEDIHQYLPGDTDPDEPFAEKDLSFYIGRKVEELQAVCPELKQDEDDESQYHCTDESMENSITVYVNSDGLIREIVTLGSEVPPLYGLVPGIQQIECEHALQERGFLYDSMESNYYHPVENVKVFLFFDTSRNPYLYSVDAWDASLEDETDYAPPVYELELQDYFGCSLDVISYYDSFEYDDERENYQYIDEDNDISITISLDDYDCINSIITYGSGAPSLYGVVPGMSEEEAAAALYDHGCIYDTTEDAFYDEACDAYIVLFTEDGSDIIGMVYASTENGNAGENASDE